MLLCPVSRLLVGPVCQCGEDGSLLTWKVSVDAVSMWVSCDAIMSENESNDESQHNVVFFLAEQLSRFAGFGIGLVRWDLFCKNIIHYDDELRLYRCILRRETSF